MTRTVELTARLDCAPEEAWRHVRTSALLDHVAAPLIVFRPSDGRPFPKLWTEGEHRAWMWLGGVLPIGWQVIGIEFPENEPGRYRLRDNGYGPLIRRWDHWIVVESDGNEAGGGGTLYRDTVHIDAGLLTPLVAGFARLFYGHRQRRWRALARDGFAPLR